jgi:hypothetical protein
MAPDATQRPPVRPDFEQIFNAMPGLCLGEPRPAQRDKSILRIDLSGERRSGARPGATRGRDGKGRE